MATNHCRPEDFVLSFAHVDLDKAIQGFLQNRTVDLAEMANVGVVCNALRIQVALVQSDMRNFRLGVGAPRDEHAAEALAPKEEGVADNHPRHEVADMGELIRRADVTHSEDALVCGLEGVVHPDTSSPVKVNPRSLEPHPLHVGNAACCEKERIHHKRSIQHLVSFLALSGTLRLLRSATPLGFLRSSEHRRGTAEDELDRGEWTAFIRVGSLPHGSTRHSRAEHDANAILA
mmetsp:Transcript_27423/g.88127  ORF Transcript_27423/g.88127 Transcript_27423/m.88127 type:complete len:233 (+) Transcript_27423:241-939(+)